MRENGGTLPLNDAPKTQNVGSVPRGYDRQVLTITQPSNTDTTSTKTGPKTQPKDTKQANQPDQPTPPIRPETRHPHPEQPRDPQRLPRPTYQAATMPPAPWAARDWKAKKS